MRINEFDYDLPQELVAQIPRERGNARMMVLHRADGRIDHRHVFDLPDYLHAGDTIVLNDTRVSARRLRAFRQGGEPTELLLLKPIGSTRWEILARPARPLNPGAALTVRDPSRQMEVQATVVSITPGGGRLIELPDEESSARLAQWGEIPLPPYIHTPLPSEQEERYQTVYARDDGSAAAPTAGLHFTEALLEQISRMGVRRAMLTLHVGIDTFRPVRVDDLSTHTMHGESAFLPLEAADIINTTTGRVVAIGTTSVRALETAAQQAADLSVGSRVTAYSGDTRLFITPGFQFRAVDALLTNFHLPRSTLLVLVSALAGHDLVLSAYAEAVRLRYRFYSFGDAMLIL